MDRGKLLLIIAVACYSIALIFFWVATSGTSKGWYVETSESAGTKLNLDYGTLSYTLTVTVAGSSVVLKCDYSGNNGTLCQNIPTMDVSGEFVLVDTIFAWLCLMPALACLIVYTFFSTKTPSLGLAKTAWALGAVTFFWSIWGWIVFVIKFSGSSASPSWAWALNFVAFFLTMVALALSIAGVRLGSEAYEVYGDQERGVVHQPHHHDEDDVQEHGTEI